MAITAATRTDIIELVVLATGGAPGTTLLGSLVETFESSGSLAGVASALTSAASFKAKYPSFQTPEEFGAEFLDSILPGLDAAVKAEGVAAIAAVMNGGGTRGDVLVQAAAFLSALDTGDAAFGSSAALFQNQVTVATYHTVELELDTGLTDALSGVTSDSTSVTDKQGTLDGTGASATAYTAAQAAADAAITAATDAVASVADTVSAYTAAAATAAETDAVALKAVSDASTAAATAAAAAKVTADANVVTAQEALNTAIAGGDANAVSTANGNLIIAQSVAATAATNETTTAATAATDLAATQAAEAADAAAATAAAAVNTLAATIAASTAGADAVAAAAAAVAAADAYAADAATTNTTTDDTAAAAAQAAAAASVTAAAAAAETFNTGATSIATTATAIAQVGLEATAAEALAAYNAAAATAAASLSAANTAKAASDAAATAATASSATITEANAYVAAAAALKTAAATAATDAAAETTAAAALKAATDATTTTTDDAAATSAETTAASNTTSAAALVTAGASAETAAAAIVPTFAAQEFVLTSATNLFTGGAGNDTFTADVSTLTAADVLKGGTGTDTLNFTGTTNVALPSADISGIEVFNIRQTTAALASTDLSLYGGVTNVNLDRSNQAATFTNMPSGGEYGIIGNGVVTNTGALALGYAATTPKAAVINFSGGTLGAQAITLTGTGLTSTTFNSSGADNVTGNFVDAATSKTLTINAASKFTIGTIDDGAGGAVRTTIVMNATGGKITTGAITSAAATTVTITGDGGVSTNLNAVVAPTITVSGAGAVSLGTLNNAAKTITSTQTGGSFTATLGTLVTQTVSLGDGNDTITTPSLVLTTGSVNGGGGSDKLVIGSNVGNVNTATLGAKYTNFETLSLNGTLDVSLISGITAIELSGATNNISKLTATQAADITATANIGATTIALQTATGTSDAVTLKMGTGLTTAAATTAGVLTLTGFETLNMSTNHGPSATTGANRTTTVTGAIVDANLTAINLTGSAFNFTNIATTKAVTIDATALVGDGATTPKGLTVAGSAVAGSTIKGSPVGDTFTIGAEGSTYQGNAGKDSFTTTVAILTADGTTDVVLDGGADSDTLTISDTTTTLTDNQFTNVSNMETLALSNTAGDLSLTTGAAFNSAFSSGATITTGKMANGTALTYNGGLTPTNTKITVDADLMVGGAAGKDVSIVTGSGSDTITFTGDATWVGATGDGSSIIVSSGAGDDTISVTIGALLVQTTSQAITITGGTGVDTITKVGTNKTNVAATAHFVMASGDSNAAVGAFDKITGFDYADGTNFSDVLDFAGAGAVGTLATSTDFGTIKSHSITAGIAKFDDAATYAAQLVINSSNLADVIGYLAANTATNDAVAFTYDSTGNGAADATMVYSNQATDSLVMLVGITDAAALTATATTATAKNIVIA